MTRDLTASQARTVSTTDLVIYNEIDTIQREIMAQALLGNLTATVENGTTMTESTPVVTITGTEADPAVGVAGESLTIAATTIYTGSRTQTLIRSSQPSTNRASRT
jgi:hypothetical protein